MKDKDQLMLESKGIKKSARHAGKKITSKKVRKKP